MNLDAQLTASQAALAVGVTKQTFNHWRKQGYVQAVGADQGRAIYRYGDVLQVERAMRNANQSSRGAVRRRLRAA